MLSPPPFTVKTPLESDALPGCPTLPTSSLCQGAGSVGGGGRGGGVEPFVTDTESSVDVLIAPVFWLQTIKPAIADDAIDVDVVPTRDQVLPFEDVKADTVLPLRDSFSQIGAPSDEPAMNVVSPPDDERVMNSIPPPGRTSRVTWRALGDNDSRNITPALANWLVFATDATRATISTSPLTDRCTYWNPSADPQMLSPPPFTVKTPLENDALPGCPTLPTSSLCQGAGSDDGGGGVVLPPVVNDHVGDDALIDAFFAVALVRDRIRQ
jgi:hypothetical protein